MATSTCNPGPRPDFIPLPDCARMVMRYTVFGQTVENVFYFAGNEPFNEAALHALAGEAHAQWATFYQPVMPDNVTLIDITCTATDVQNADQWIEPVNLPGTNISPAFPDPGCTFAIKFSTGKTGRSYRGRMYWPALQNSSVVNGAISSAYATELAGVNQDFFTEIKLALGYDHVVASYQAKCAWREVAVPTPVIAYTYVDLNVDSQRRRLIGRGI